MDSPAGCHALVEDPSAKREAMLHDAPPWPPSIISIVTTTSSPLLQSISGSGRAQRLHAAHGDSVARTPHRTVHNVGSRVGWRRWSSYSRSFRDVSHKPLVSEKMESLNALDAFIANRPTIDMSYERYMRVVELRPPRDHVTPPIIQIPSHRQYHHIFRSSVVVVS